MTTWPSPASLPDLSDHQREQYTLAASGSLGILGGRPGCLHGDTLIYDPVDQTTLSVSDRELSGMSFHVFAMTQNGSVIVSVAEPPWKYQPAKMLRISFASGRQICVTEGHRFWDGRQYVSAATIESFYRTGLSVFLPSMSPTPSRSVLREDGRRSSRIVPNCQASCFADCRPCGEQLRFFQDTGQSSFPLQDDVLQPHHAWLRSDETEHICTNICQQSACHHASNHCVFPSEPRFGNADRIVNIEDAGIHEYYDFHVPGHENYWAEGFFHHNTGKTYTLARILSAIPAGRSAVAAPTGKAAVRITESLQRAGIGNMRATTIHSLLGPSRDEDSGEWSFEHNADNPLDLDWIFVDEGSMCDCPLTASLLEARAPGCRIMFIGDVNQLAPVGFGAPLRDMIAAGLPYGELTEIQRNSGRIVQCCHGIIDKHCFEPSPELNMEAESPENLLHVERTEPDGQAESLKAVLEKFRSGAKLNGKRIDSVWDVQIIVPVNEKSPLCRVRLNRILQGFLNPGGDSVDGNQFRVNDKIVCGQNGWTPVENRIPKSLAGGPFNQSRKEDKVYVANGEQGRVLSVQSNYTVARLWLPDRLVRIPKGNVSQDEDGNVQDTGCNWELAYAVSCHKSQGSQWPVAIVIADAYPGAQMLCDRSWLYTGLSRAETLAITIGQRDVLDGMCGKSNMWNRKTFLVESVQELQQQALVRRFEEALA